MKNIIIFVFISCSGLFGMVMDYKFGIKHPVFFWLLGLLSGMGIAVITGKLDKLIK